MVKREAVYVVHVLVVRLDVVASLRCRADDLLERFDVDATYPASMSGCLFFSAPEKSDLAPHVNDLSELPVGRLIDPS